MTAPELKPCPFCGETQPPHDDTSWVRCLGCGAETGWQPTGDEAIAAWNRRADLAAVQPARVRVKWDGIETAPRGGEWFIARTEHGTTRVVHFADEYDRLPISHDGVVWSTTPTEWTPLEPVLAAIEPQPDPRELTVWYGKMPESNGRENWTAILRPKAGDNLNGILDGFCFAWSEYPDRVRYEADRMRWIIGELTEKPDILAYDADLHSGYVERPDPRNEVIKGMVEALEFYADEDTYETQYERMPCDCCTDIFEPINDDKGSKARAALAAAKAVQHG